MTDTSQKRYMVELQARLDADTSGELTTSMLKELGALQTRLQRQRQQLNSPERYRELQAALLAVNGAIDALGKLRVRGGRTMSR